VEWQVDNAREFHIKYKPGSPEWNCYDNLLLFLIKINCIEALWLDESIIMIGLNDMVWD
jgi:hypothetical protein